MRAGLPHRRRRPDRRHRAPRAAAGEGREARLTSRTFVGQRRFLFGWLFAALLAALGAVYAFARPAGGHRGGTPLGLAYGALAFLLLLFLMWYGARKRYAHVSGRTRLVAWLGAHVWAGLALVVLVPLHSGGRLHANAHGAAYLLLLATSASGLVGTWAYVVLPAQMLARRDGVTPESAVAEIERLAAEMTGLARGRSAAFLRVANELAFPFDPGLTRLLFGRAYPALPTAAVRALPAEERGAGMELLGLAHRRLRVCNQVIDEAGVAARLRVWLYVHLPLSFATLAAACAHVFWVLYYGWPLR